jgi:acyl-coenzyme A synthetase/AMP-(fatty) acid ligase
VKFNIFLILNYQVDTTTGKQILFKDAEEKTKRVASALARRGFGRGDFLYFITYDFVDLEVLQLAVWMLGGATRGGFPKGAPSINYITLNYDITYYNLKI